MLRAVCYAGHKLNHDNTYMNTYNLYLRTPLSNMHW